MIRQGAGPGQGERTDIHVDAVLRDSHGDTHDVVSVIIEVKGCWNPELGTAMRTQLVDRYLKDNPCRHGLYLIGWFKCDQWDNSDDRKRRTPQLDKDGARKRFDTQAADLSQEGIRIKAFIMNTAIR